MGGEADPKAFFYKPPWSQRDLNETQDWNFTLNEANFNSQTVVGEIGIADQNFNKIKNRGSEHRQESNKDPPSSKIA